MRKQYHFRPSSQGTLAWDVDRLVRLSKDLPIQKILLSQIREIDECYWGNPTCRNIFEHYRLIQECDLSFPIILSADGGIMDGMHRVGKAFLEGREFINAVKFEHDPDPDYVGKEEDEFPYEPDNN